MKNSFLKAGKTYGQSVQDIELEAQKLWRQENVYATPSTTENGKKYILGMFPYPSGNAHMGHALVYSITDTIARLERFLGHSVLHPLGWDAFGLPAENAAIQRNVNPSAWTEKNIKIMREEQIGRMGFSFDPNRELNTASPEYYKWTQWLFLKMQEKGLIYRSKEWVNWDPVDQTVLANEQVIDGKGWRSGTDIERRQMEQWYVRITDYAEDLWHGLDTLEGWSESAKGVQRNWIGRSEGADIDFTLDNNDKITAFTSTPQALYGVSAIVLSLENELIKTIVTDEQRTEVAAYVAQGMRKSEIARQSETPNGGIFTGRYAKHPLTQQDIPVYVADYVLNTHGVVASLCIPGNDARDMEFARAASLPVITVLENDTVINSGPFNGLDTEGARNGITEKLTVEGTGKKNIRYRLRDWSISRQRFWGSPIPMIQNEAGSWHRVPEEQLPVRLPDEVDFTAAKGKSPLAIDESFKNYVDDNGNQYTREVDTMDTFMCSSWYVWRFLNPGNDEAAWAKEDAFKWMPVDKYVGGLEHANQHLIYLRFMSHFLYDLGLTPTKEPIASFLDNGMVQLEGKKMSKSRGNVVRPDEMISKYGADALHMYILANGPADRNFEWSEGGLSHKQAFLNRIYNLYKSVDVPKGVIQIGPASMRDQWSCELLQALKTTADEVVSDVKRDAFHVLIAKTHTFANELFARRDQITTPERSVVYGYAMQNYLKVLGLTAPHLSDVLWREAFNNDCSLFTQPWVSVDASAITMDQKTTVKVPVLVNGKKKGTTDILASDSDDDIITGIIQNKDTSSFASAFERARLDKGFVIRDAQTGKIKMINLKMEPL